MTMEMPELFTPTQAASALNVHLTTIFRWFRAGHLKPVLVAGQRLIPESEIIKAKTLIEAGKLQAPGNRTNHPGKKKTAGNQTG
jgi:excisionase family DNA binding protein